MSSILSPVDMETIRTNSIRRLTAKQLANMELPLAKSTVMMIDGRSVHNVLVVGWLSGSKRTSNSFLFTIYDGTGHIDCCIWQNNTNATRLAADRVEGDFVMVIGSISAYNQKAVLNCTHIGLVEDGNYLAFHLLTCIQQHQENVASCQAPLESGLAADAQADESLLGYTENNSGVWNRPAASKVLSRIHMDTIECFQRNQGDTGLKKAVAQKMLMSHGYSAEEIAGAFEFLVESGKLHVSSVENDELALVECDF
ncbi:replication factor A2 [Nematocida homosporus]|uniref:replication factor A2 n=1 Tax=Nematocida homosporus TaxID=1912981 RepID=UPI00221F14D5|nr:replication factor A2 [Nematocida homosporus]KAI5187173.1 replication factor A2 [Nematocida homosporus]